MLKKIIIKRQNQTLPLMQYWQTVYTWYFKHSDKESTNIQRNKTEMATCWP